jgi:Flp pilus assembly protein TadG
MNWFTWLATPSRRDRRAERGQIIILFALAAIVVLGMVAIAVDGGYGLVQVRRAQNAADFATVAGTKELTAVCQGSGNPPSNQTVYRAIQDVIDKNAPAVGSNWSGQYLDSTGAAISGGTVTNSSSTVPPPTACGVSITVNPAWKPFIAQVLGVKSLTGSASAKSVVNPGVGQAIGIVALDYVSPHEVLGGGLGTFTVYGTIFANSTVFYSPWNELRNGLQYNDVVDAKDNSNLILHGIMETLGGSWPLDWCFGANASGGDNGTFYNATDPDPDPDADPDPYNQAICSGGTGSASVTLKYNQIVNGQAQITDPLAPPSSGTGGVADPFDKTSSNPGYTLGLCPGQTTPPVYNSLPGSWTSGGVTVLQPGDYTFKVDLASNVQFADCSGVYNPDPKATSNYPGIFRFEKGLRMRPSATQTVQGNNVMIATGSPLAVPANVPGSFSGSTFNASGTGNGAPCFPAGTTTKESPAFNNTDGTNKCGGTDPASAPPPYNTIYSDGPYYGVVSRNQKSFATDGTHGTGTNFSLMLGGAGTITLSSPTTGPFRGIISFQQRSVPANSGLDAEPGDTANVTLTGLVYNASLECNGFPVVSGSCTNANTAPSSDPFGYWDSGVPFHDGGTMQTGVGTGNGYTRASGGNVTVNGACLVSNFNTDGNTNITIDGRANTYSLPGVLGSGNPPVVG